MQNRQTPTCHLALVLLVASRVPVSAHVTTAAAVMA